MEPNYPKHQFYSGEIKRNYMDNNGELATDKQVNVALIKLDSDMYIRYWDYITGSTDQVLFTQPRSLNTWYVDKDTLVDSINDAVEHNAGRRNK